MRWLRRSRPSYAVDGVEPQRSSDGWDVFPGDALTGLPAAVEAAARLPEDPVLDDLPDYLSVATKDGREWTLGFDDGMLIVFGLSRPGTDVFEQVLTAAPWTESVERVDREVFLFTTTGMLTADVVLAHCVDVCGEVFRRRGGSPPA
ncbi:hypothetical protein ONO23_02500 [Micromonospora noduli]|uniref:Uncharacterized protein n=1 Tax=Micromonospora noduli TaxID=709876 RepID=A0ABX9CS01_9ACTN|nr:hypothetical protein [Micromonospora noduli]RAO08896.1 hypothetical protein MED15_06360 [Micromonospora noduli]RAO34770.1 hypothetical protein ONO23_02500 [Micromonospora noduli]